MFSLLSKCCFSKEKSDDITIINPNKFKGKIIIGYCRRYETFIIIIITIIIITIIIIIIIIIIKLQEPKDQYKRLVPKKFSYKFSY